MRLSLETNYETTNDKRGDDDAITMMMRVTLKMT